MLWLYVYYNWRVCCGFMFIITGACVVAFYVYYNWRVCCGFMFIITGACVVALCLL